MVSVPWVMTMAFSRACLHALAMTSRSASSISRLSFIIRVWMRVSSNERPIANISGTWVFLKNNSPLSSLYSLSKVPPVINTAIFIGSFAATIKTRVG